MKSAPFKVQLRAKSSEGRKVYSFRSARGIRSPRNVRREELFLLQLAEVDSTDALLVVDSRIGVEGVVLGEQAGNGRTMMTCSKARSALISELNRRKNGLESGEVMLTGNLYKDCIRKFDRAFFAPGEEPLHLSRQKMYDAARKLREDGVLYVAVEKERADEIKTLLEDLGTVDEFIKDEMKGFRVEKGEFHGDKDLLNERKFEHQIKGEEVRIDALDGFFSAEQVNMSEMIVREMDAAEGDSVLDGNCFFGSTGVFLQRLYGPEVSFLDRDAYLTRYTSRNAEKNGLDRYKVYTEDGLENAERSSFDYVTYRVRGQDRRQVQEDVRDGFRSLKKGGSMFLCHEKDFPGESVLNRVFGNYSARRREFDYQLSVAEK